MGMLRNGRYVRPATCGVRQLRELGCALGQLVQVAEICIAALSGRLEMPCECASRPHIHARVCTWHAIVQMEVRMCYRRPRRVYASRCPELKRAVRSPGRCSRAAKGRFLQQFEYLNGCNGCFAVSFGQMSSPCTPVYTKHKHKHKSYIRITNTNTNRIYEAQKHSFLGQPHACARQAATDARAHRSRVVAAARSSQNDTRRFHRGESAAGPPHSDGNRAAPKGHGS